MSFNEDLKIFLDSPELAKAVEDTIAIDYREPMKNDRQLWDAIVEAQKEIETDNEAKADPWILYRRFLVLFRMHYAYIGVVHPLMSVGKSRLSKWRQSVETYEKMRNGAHPVVSSVTEKEINKIRHLVPEYVLKSVSNPNHHILAAIRWAGANIDIDSDTDRPVVAGVLSFTVDTSGSDNVVNIDWIMADSEHRDADPEDALLAEMFYMLKDTDIAAFTFDLPVGKLANDDGSYMVDLMERWHFMADLVPDQNLRTNVSALVKAGKKMEKPDPGTEVLPLDKMDESLFKRTVRRFSSKESEIYGTNINFINKDFYHPMISCFARNKNGSISGILTAYIDHRKDLVINMAEAESEEIWRDILEYAIEEIQGRFPASQQVIIPVRSPEVAEFTDVFLPDSAFGVKIRFVMIKPEGDQDITEDEWEEACAMI